MRCPESPVTHCVMATMPPRGRQDAGGRPHWTPAPALTPELADQAIVGLAAGDGHDQDAYVLTAAGLRSLS